MASLSLVIGQNIQGIRQTSFIFIVGFSDDQCDARPDDSRAVPYVSGAVKVCGIGLTDTEEREQDEHELII